MEDQPLKPNTEHLLVPVTGKKKMTRQTPSAKTPITWTPAPPITSPQIPTPKPVMSPSSSPLSTMSSSELPAPSDTGPKQWVSNGVSPVPTLSTVDGFQDRAIPEEVPEGEVHGCGQGVIKYEMKGLEKFDDKMKRPPDQLG